MNPPTPSRLEAKSKQGLWPIYVLVPAALLLGWVAYDVGMSDSTAGFTGKGRVLANFPPAAVVAFFSALALICLACVALALNRYLRPKTELVIDGNGVTSNLFWRRGALQWEQITHLTQQQDWLFVHGRAAGSAKPKKLTIALKQLDHPPDQILAHLRHHRPDLFG
jgi:hypothetical protein